MKLLVQMAQPVIAEHLKQIQQISGASECQPVNAYSALLMHISNPVEGVAAYCTDHQIDYAELPDEQPGYGLVVMDMDSTLITIECIDEIADMYQLKPQVAAITEAAMRGEIDFAESLRRRVKLLAGLEASALQRVYDQRLQLSPGAETLIAALKRHSIKTMLVSGGFNFFTDRLQQRLGLDYAYANTLEIIEGRLTGQIQGAVVDANAKAEKLIAVRDQLGLAPDAVAAMGDGANDLQMMSAAGIGVAYHAKPVVQQQADYALNFTGLDGLLPLLGVKELAQV